MGWRDDWPSRANGQKYDGKLLLQLLRDNDSLFDGVWDVKLLLQEIEEILNTRVTDIPIVDNGSNNYGFHVKTSSKGDLVARIARGDVNMPDFDGFSIEKQVPEVLFEAAVYKLLADQPKIRASHLLYFRTPIQQPGPRLSIPSDISGRRLFVFERAEGVNNVWEELDARSKVYMTG
jgi:hypothetical protein